MAAGSGWGGIHPSVRYAKNKTFPVATRGRCHFKSWFLCRRHQAGSLVLLSSLDLIGPIMSENLVFSWRFIKLWRHATVTRCDEKSIFELVCISILLWWHSSWLEVDLMKALGQVRQSKNMEWPLNAKWRASCWDFHNAPRDFSLWLVTIHLGSDFWENRSKGNLRAAF